MTIPSGKIDVDLTLIRRYDEMVENANSIDVSWRRNNVEMIESTFDSTWEQRCLIDVDLKFVKPPWNNVYFVEQR